jgi:chromosome segregation ATPase
MRRELDAAGRAIERELNEARAEADRRAREAEEQAARELAAMHARLQDERSAMRMTIERLETENANLRRRESEARRRLNEYAAAPSTVEEPAADEAEAIRAEPAIEEDVIAPAEAPIAATPEGAAPDAEARPMGRAAGPRDAAPARVGPSGLTEEEIVAEIARLQGVIEALKRGEAAAGSMPSAKPQARRIPPDRR